MVRRRAVERAQNTEVADETDRVQKRREENQVANTSIGEKYDSFQHRLASICQRAEDGAFRANGLWEFSPGLAILRDLRIGHLSHR